MHGTKNSIHPLTYRYCQGGPAKGTDMNLMSAAFDLVHLFNKSGKADVIRAKKALNCLWCHSLQHSDNSPWSVDWKCSLHMLDIFSRKKVKSNLIFFLSTSCKKKQKLLLVYTQSLVLNASCSVLSCSRDDFRTKFSQSFEGNFCPIRTRGRPCKGARVCQAKVTSSSWWSRARAFINVRYLNRHQNSEYFPDLPKQMALVLFFSSETCTEFALQLKHCYGHTCNKWTLTYGPSNIETLHIRPLLKAEWQSF